MDLVLKIFEAVGKFAPWPTFAVMLSSAIVLFAPVNILTILGLDQFKIDYKPVLGWAFLLSSTYLTSFPIRWVCSFSKRKLDEFWLLKNGKKALQELTAGEKGYLVPFIIYGQNTIQCEMTDGIAGGLLAKKIIYRSSNTFTQIQGVPYNINPWAKRYLVKYPKLLEGSIPLQKAQYYGA